MRHDLKNTEVIYFQKGMPGATLTNGIIIRSFSYDEYFVIQEDRSSGEASMKKMTSKEVLDSYGLNLKISLPNT